MPETSLKTEVNHTTWYQEEVRSALTLLTSLPLRYRSSASLSLLSCGVPISLEKLAEKLKLTIPQTRTIAERLELQREIVVQIRNHKTFLSLVDR